MGQAWCKEKTTKAQDSKSPLDRVFVRCAHRIYPGLKEEGSVLGGATQRVTSSEIGYAGSPPREVLTRGRSIDSVDRPFHPSEWVDVNLEVPSTPRPSSVLTNLTVDTGLYPATTTPTSSCSNPKDVTPIPPPRRRKRNKGRPLPPKPDEIGPEKPARRVEGNDEPLYSSVRSPKSSGDEAEEEPGKHRPQDDAGRDGRRSKEIYEHKVNGTGRVISSDVVSGRRAFDLSQQQRRARESEEYERFSRNRTSRDSSTPNREEKRKPVDVEKQTKDAERSGNARTKNYSTVSLPNYDELDASRHRSKEADERERGQDKTSRKSRRPVRSSTGSLPVESFLSPFSEKTSVRLEDYIPRSDNLSPYQVLEKLDCGANGVVRDEFVKYDPSKSEDWELGDVENSELNHQRRLSFEDTQRIGDEKRAREDEEDVVDFSGRDGERGSPSPVPDAFGSSTYLGKPEAFGKTASPVLGQSENIETVPNSSHPRYFEPPTLTESCRISPACEMSGSKQPFFLDEAKHRSASDTIGAKPSGAKPKSDQLDHSRMMFTRSLSIESEPNEDTFEEKELDGHVSTLIRTISEESLPREMLDEESFEDLPDGKLAKDEYNKLKKSMDDWKTLTPPPSPELKPRSEARDSDHSTLLKVLKEEAEESNLSSMTPSLTELEAALSDMLEKEDPQEGSKDENRSKELKKLEVEAKDNSAARRDKEANEGKLGDQNLVVHEANAKNEAPTSLKQILEDRKPATTRKISFCTWEESVAELEALESAELTRDSDNRIVPRGNEGIVGDSPGCSTDLPPEKPNRLNRSLDDLVEGTESVPTPPRRRHRSVGAVRKESEVSQNGSAIAEPFSNDRLI